MSSEAKKEILKIKKQQKDINDKILRLLSVGMKYEDKPIQALQRYSTSLDKEIDRIKLENGLRR